MEEMWSERLGISFHQVNNHAENILEEIILKID
jgi:hypothetical protein